MADVIILEIISDGLVVTKLVTGDVEKAKEAIFKYEYENKKANNRELS
jgi:hypothetical protein